MDLQPNQAGDAVTQDRKGRSLNCYCCNATHRAADCAGAAEVGACPRAAVAQKPSLKAKSQHLLLCLFHQLRGSYAKSVTVSPSVIYKLTYGSRVHSGLDTPILLVSGMPFSSSF